MEKINLVHIIPNNSQIGGVNSFVTDLAISQSKNISNRVFVLSLMNDKKSQTIDLKFQNTSVNFYCLGFNSNIHSIINFMKLRIFLRKYALSQNSIFHFHLKISEIVGTLSTLFFSSIKKIVVYHSFYKRYYLQTFFIKRLVDKYIAVSKEAKKDLIKNFKVRKDKVIVIYNGIDTSIFKDIKGLPSSSKNRSLNFISVGRFTSQKNFIVSISAFNNLSLNYKYSIIGSGTQFNEIKILSENNHRITLCGSLSRNETILHISKSDIVIIPSLHEGNSIFLLEALAMKKPLILSNITSFLEYLNEYDLTDSENFRICKWGILFRNNSSSLVSALEYIISNKHLLKVFTSYLNTISSFVNIDNVARSYENLY